MMKRNEGFTLVELLVAMVVGSVVGWVVGRVVGLTSSLVGRTVGASVWSIVGPVQPQPVSSAAVRTKSMIIILYRFI